MNALGPLDHRVYLGIGSNIRPVKNIPAALELLKQQVRLAAVSTAWQNPAIGGEGPDFVNAAVLILTDIPLNQLKENVLHPIEARLGRVRTLSKNAPRTIDLDILGIDNQIIEQNVWRYPHLAVPLAELNPGYTHPITDESLIAVAKHLAFPTRMYPRPDILVRADLLQCG